MKIPIKRGDQFSALRVEELTTEGQGILRMDGFVVFVEGAVPGDIVDLQIRNVKKKYAEAVITGINVPSDQRTTPTCDHFGTCGGCRMQHIVYDTQLKVKRQSVIDALERIGKVSFPEVEPIAGSAKIYGYRNRLDFAFSSKRWLTREEIASGEKFDEPAIGFHIPGRFDKVLDVQECHLQGGISNQIRTIVKEHAKKNGLAYFDTVSQEGFLRNLIIRSTSTGEWMVILVFKQENREAREALLDALRDRFPELTSIQYVINGKRNDTIFDQEVVLHHGRDHIFEEMEGLRFKVSAKSFYQTNSDQALTLYRTAREFAGLTGNENVYDLYTGTGTIALFLARSARHVAGIDYIEDAILDARQNAIRNGIPNAAFEAGDLKATLNADFTQKYGRPDVIVTDPPRSGMHPDVVLKLTELKPDRIVYVSCNPTTQARDLQMLDNEYQIGKVRPVDMFPHTMHVENVVLLQRRS
ncbi:MAG: 23S rRNA (uracil(1939)-C(5))-methyltransferase RlmD [Bacteroidota bacterium]